MRNKLAMFLGVVVMLSLSSNVWSQNPITMDSPFQIRYAANLNIGDSFVNLTNSGAANADICTNVYVFAPDEQLVSCCSCVITPNALQSLSVRNDLTSNTLTPAVPNSVTIKLLATTGGSCNAATPGTLTPGLLAWGTTVHRQTTTATSTTPNTTNRCLKNYCNTASPPNPTWCNNNCPPITTTTATSTDLTTETPFLPATLSAGELASLSSECGFIQNVGSGYGICRSCRLGGQ